MIKDIFTVYFVVCNFGEIVFPKLGGGKDKELVKEIMWNILLYFDPHNMNWKFKMAIPFLQ